MKKEYKRHNNVTITEILEVYRSGKIFNALRYIQEYNQKFPKDIKGKVIEGKLLRLSNRPNEAEEILTQILSFIPTTSEFYSNALIELILTEIALENYKKAYYFYNLYSLLNIPSELEYMNMSTIRIFLLKKIGEYSQTVPRSMYNYNEKQMIHYNREECIDWCKNNPFILNGENKNMGTDLQSMEEENGQYFKEEVDFEALFSKLEKVLPYAKKLYGYSAFDYFIIKTNEIGFDKFGPLNHLKVVALREDDKMQIVRITPYRVQCNKNFINNFNELEIKYYIENESPKREIKAN